MADLDDADGINRFTTEITAVIPIEATDLGRFIRGLVSTKTIVCKILPFVITIDITFARPITNATNAIEARPFANSLPILSKENCPIIPQRTATTMLTEIISLNVIDVSPVISG